MVLLVQREYIFFIDIVDSWIELSDWDSKLVDFFCIYLLQSQQ